MWVVGYLERLGLARGVLMIFDARSSAIPLPQRMTREEVVHEGRQILGLML